VLDEALDRLLDPRRPVLGPPEAKGFAHLRREVVLGQGAGTVENQPCGFRKLLERNPFCALVQERPVPRSDRRRVRVEEPVFAADHARADRGANTLLGSGDESRTASFVVPEFDEPIYDLVMVNRCFHRDDALSLLRYRREGDAFLYGSSSGRTNGAASTSVGNSAGSGTIGAGSAG
jgi:hypothetical protein